LTEPDIPKTIANSKSDIEINYEYKIFYDGIDNHESSPAAAKRYWAFYRAMTFWWSLN
jgi:hypothetical protein